MFFFVLFLILLALLLQYFFSKGSLKFIREDLRPETKVVDPETSFDLLITVENTGRHYIPFLRLKFPLPSELETLSQAHVSEDPTYHSRSFGCTTLLHPRQALKLRLPVRIRKRGRFMLPHLTVSVGDFLGISEESRTQEHFNEVVVAPGRWQDSELPAVLGGFLGEVSINRFLYEDPILTVGFREYTGREPMKMISWTQSARSNELLVRKYDHTMEPRAAVLLNVDTNSWHGPESLEDLCSMARSICETLEEQGISYTLITNAALAGNWAEDKFSSVLSGVGSVHFEHVLECLGRVTGQASASAEEFISYVIGTTGTSSRVLITEPGGMPSGNLLNRLKEVSGGNLLILTPSEGKEKSA